jgi:hypothetical protein
VAIGTLKTGEAQGDIDPYAEWLSIGQDNRPITHYALMGFSQAEAAGLIGRPLTEREAKRVEAAADRNMGFVRNYQNGKYSNLSQRILNELSAAKIALLDAQKKASYDATLGVSLQIGGAIPGVRMGVFGTAGSKVVPDVPAVPPAVKRPAPRPPSQNGGNGNGSHKAPELIVVDQESVPPAPPVVTETDFQFANADRSLRYKKPEEDPWYTQTWAKITGIAAGTAGAAAVVFAAWWNSQADEKPVVENRNKPAIKQPGENGHKPIIRPSEDPVVTPPVQPAIVKVETVPVPPPDPDAEAKKKAEEERKKMEEAKKKFDADVATTAAELKVKYGKLKAEQVKKLQETEKDPVRLLALEKVHTEKQEAEAAQTGFEQDVQTLYKELTTKYQKFDAKVVLEAARNEKDAKAKCALCVLAMSKFSQAGDLAGVNETMDVMNDPHFPREKEVAIKAQLFAMQPNVNTVPPDTRMAVAKDLLGQVGIAYQAEQFDTTATRLVETTDKYLKGLMIPTNDRSRVEKGIQLKALRERLAKEKEILGRNVELFTKYQGGLDGEGQPKDAAARYDAGRYFAEVHGKWGEALPNLAGCNNDHIAAAAKLEMEKPPKTAAEYLAVAQAWVAAADIVQNPGVWYKKAAGLLWKARGEKPTGTTKLDIDMLAEKLGEKGYAVGPVGVGGEPPVAPEMFPKGKWVQMDTSGIDTQRDSKRQGNWAIVQGKLVQTQSDKTGVLQLPLELPNDKKNYDLRVGVNRKEGLANNDHGLGLLLPVGDKSVVLCIGRLKLSGLQLNLNGQQTELGDNNPTTVTLDIPNNTDLVIDVSIRQNGDDVHVAAAIGGRQFVNWHGKSDQLFPESIFENFDNKQVGLYCRTPTVFSSPQVRKP